MPAYKQLPLQNFSLQSAPEANPRDRTGGKSRSKRVPLTDLANSTKQTATKQVQQQICLEKLIVPTQRAIPPSSVTSETVSDAEAVPPTRIAPDPAKFDLAADPQFNPLAQCRPCGAPLCILGLDHSLCSGSCGWVVDLTWLAAHPPKRSEPSAQAATHNEEHNSKNLTLFNYELDYELDCAPSPIEGGAA